MLQSRGGVRQQALRIKVIRKDGTIEDHGLVAFRHKNFFINFVVNLWIGFKAWQRRKRNIAV